jgi:hypothetical protein
LVLVPGPLARADRNRPSGPKKKRGRAKAFVRLGRKIGECNADGQSPPSARHHLPPGRSPLEYTFSLWGWLAGCAAGERKGYRAVAGDGQWEPGVAGREDGRSAGRSAACAPVFGTASNRPFAAFASAPIDFPPRRSFGRAHQPRTAGP